jgi:hypothetical protein
VIASARAERFGQRPFIVGKSERLETVTNISAGGSTRRSTQPEHSTNPPRHLDCLAG